MEEERTKSKLNTELSKIFEDEDILVINKPSGLIVNRSITAKSDTLQDLLDIEYKSEDTEEEDTTDYSERSGIVHRLDKDTSGVLVIAKNAEAFVSLTTQFKERKAIKVYKAIVLGKVDYENIEINAPIKRRPRDPFKFAVVDDGKEAVTFVERNKEKTFGDAVFTDLIVKPKTGRTHQIRVHLAAMGTPVAGDKIYSTKKQLEISEKYFNRLMLHAYSLSFFHPSSNKLVTFESNIPSEFNF